jgi:hypothetical protein
VELLFFCKLKGLVWLHYFLPEESLSSSFIDLTVEFRDHEWKNLRVLKIVLSFHIHVAVSDYQSCHLRHLRPNEGLKVREYCL